MKATVKTENRFEDDASRYAAYLETPEGRLRADLSFANLQNYLRAMREASTLRALDLGCGTGAASIRLARLGINVTSLDSSPAMLDLAKQKIAEAGISGKVTLKLGDAGRLADIFQDGPFNIILCHNLLEYVDDPGVVLSGIADLMLDSSAIVSVLVRNQAGEVLKAALQSGSLDAAEHSLHAEWGQESLYSGKVRLFTPESLEAMLERVSLAPVSEYGVRVVADYLPPQISRSEEYERIFALERELGMRQEFFGIARYLQVLARHLRPPSEGR